MKQTGDLNLVKKINKSIVLHHIRTDSPISRAQDRRDYRADEGDGVESCERIDRELPRGRDRCRGIERRAQADDAAF